MSDAKDKMHYYRMGYAEADRKHRHSLAERPYIILWCVVCGRESSEKRRPYEDEYNSPVAITVGHCVTCNAYLNYGNVSYEELLEIHLGVRQEPDFIREQRERDEGIRRNRTD